MKQRTLLRACTVLLGASLLVVGLSGCVVVPVPHARSHGVVVVEPGYDGGHPPPWYRERDRPAHHRDWRY